MPKMGINKTTKAAKVAESRASYQVARQAPARTSLANALFSTTQQRVLGLLFGQPERSFFATELISLAGAGSGAVQREIQRLVESGLVTVSRVGNQKHYQANRAAPIYKELHGIVVKTLGPAGVLRAALVPLETRIHAAVLYGSVAKRSDNAASDIDVLIVADGLTLEEVYAALAPAEKRLGRSISPTLYTMKEFQRRRATGNPFVAKLLAGPHALLLGNADALA
jgi:predicted nucleotidyltransferase